MKKMLIGLVVLGSVNAFAAETRDNCKLSVEFVDSTINQPGSAGIMTTTLDYCIVEARKTRAELIESRHLTAKGLPAPSAVIITYRTDDIDFTAKLKLNP